MAHANIPKTYYLYGPNPNCAWSQLDIYYVITLLMTNSTTYIKYIIVLAVILLEQKYYTHQCRQFVAAAAICADKTLISLNRVLSTQIAVIYIEPSYRHYVGCWLSSVLS